MSTSSETLNLAGEFAPTSLDQWRELTLAVLRKSGVASEETPPQAVDELLSVVTYDGVRIPALYVADELPATGVPGTAPFTRGGRADGAVRGGWDVRQRHTGPDPAAMRQAILADLGGGVSSLWIDVGTGGLDAAKLTEVLDGVDLDLAGVVLDAGAATFEAARAFLGVISERQVSPGKVRGNLGADPLGWQARTGSPADVESAVGLANRCFAAYPRLRAITVDATVYHDAGGSDTQELGLALAAGVAYLRALHAAGLSVPAALGQLEFRYAATADQFLTIAKLRAARRLWARVADACGAVEAGAQRQHAVTSSVMMTARDPWVNMLRTTVACLAAVVGGADAVTVQPFDARLGLPDEFSRRVARNTHALLMEESHLGRVIDPAGGSWYVERLTEDLARAAWTQFTQIERAGGLAAALSSALVAEQLADTWQRRVDNLAHRRDPITGVSEFPNLGERVPARASTAPPPSGGLPRHHLAEVFEARRDRADAHAAATGVAPAVFLATLGPVAAHTARATFAANLFAAGGIAAARGPIGTDPVAIAAAFAASGSPVACICGADKAYAELAEPVAAALAAAGAKRVWLAGSPRGGYAGVDSYLYLGCDAVEVIDATLADLGVA
ncbi:methylmalonyl-CoA mutase family protein [Luedemannella flava]|uniref:Methylmalonyl-CoA mutase family protein n=1 Tax=Luedemannella flava TaxID=349316 RepID=A0ABP4XJ48_9ACTN